MAERYFLGSNRIIYRSTSFQEGLNVVVNLFHPDLTEESGIALTEIREGLYYFEHKFVKKGIYTGIFYEDGVKVTSQNFKIEDEPSSTDGAVRIIRAGSRLVNL